jgi:hypothetical protein
MLPADFFFGLLIAPEDGGGKFLRNVGSFSTNYTAIYPRKQNSLFLIFFFRILNFVHKFRTKY